MCGIAEKNVSLLITSLFFLPRACFVCWYVLLVCYIVGIKKIISKRRDCSNETERSDASRRNASTTSN